MSKDKPLADNGDNLVERADALSAEEALSDPDEIIRSIIRAGRRQNTLNRVIAFGIAALFLIVCAFAGGGVVAYRNRLRADEAVNRTIENAEDAYDACLSRNEGRLKTISVWTKYRELVLEHGPLPPSDQVLLDRLTTFVAETYAPVECEKPKHSAEP